MNIYFFKKVLTPNLNASVSWFAKKYNKQQKHFNINNNNNNRIRMIYIKTVVMMLKIQHCITGINYIFIKSVIIFQYYWSYYIFDQINAAVVSNETSFKNDLKNN